MSVAIGQQGKGAIRVASPWIERLARLGFMAKGIVYVIIGGLAVQYAFGEGGETGGTRNALRVILEQPFGQALLVLVALGLVGYSLWLFIRAGMDTENKGSDVMGSIKRIGYACIGVIYLALAGAAARLAFGVGGGGGDNSVPDWTAWLLSQPFGQWLVGITGLIVIAVGLYRIYKGYAIKFRDRLKLGQMGSTERTWTIRFGRFGLAAQGFVLVLIGVFLGQAALQAQPSEARGLGGALQSLVEQPYGPWLLAIVALGLVAHGLYMFILSRYRRINTS